MRMEKPAPPTGAPPGVLSDCLTMVVEVCIPARLKEPISPASPKVVEAECGRDWHSRAGQSDVQKSKCLSKSPKTL